MKTEDFDDAIRNKLQEVNAMASEEEVSALHQFVLDAQKGRVRKRFFILFVTAGLALLVGALFTWNMFQKNEITKLKEDLSLLEVQKRNMLDKALQTKISVKKPYAEVANLDANNASPTLNQSRSLLAATENKKQPQEKTLLKSSKQSGHVSLNAIPVSALNKTEADKNPDKFEFASTDFIPTTTMLASKDQLVEEQQMFDTIKKPDATFPIALAANTSEELPADSMVAKNASEGAGNTNELSQTKNDVEVMPYINPWKYRLGAEMLLGHEQWGSAIFGEAVLKNRLVFNAGLRMLKDGEENFETREDYDQHKSEHFKEVYGNHVEEGSHDFRIKNTVYQVPISISYIFTLKNSFSILAGLGTDIDFYTRQKITYHHTNPNAPNDLQTQRLNTVYPPVYFNNAVVSIGIQKQIKHFGVQVLPYLSPQLRKVDYKKENFNFGLRGRLFYEF